MQSFLISLAKASKPKGLEYIKLIAGVRACVLEKIVTAHSMPAKFNYSQRLQFQKQLTPLVSNMSLFGNNEKFAFNPIRTRQNFLINGPRGIDSTQQIQTLITPELQKIKNPFLLLEKLNFLTKSPNFLSLCLQP